MRKRLVAVSDQNRWVWQRVRLSPVAPAGSGQGELFCDSYSQPDAADGEPVFRLDASDPSTADDANVQADASDCSDYRLAN